MDYYPFGAIRLDEKAGAFSEQRKFTGHEYDSDTTLTYMNARYYDGVMGHFISQDPLEIVGLQTTDTKRFVQVISNPQNWNTYSYALNNPLVAVDPSGMLTLYIPGTNYNFDNVANSHLGSSLQETFNEKPYIFNWSGEDNSKARTEAAQKLANIINTWDYNDGEKLNIVSHSHGGNVVNEATWLIDRKIDNNVTYAIPVLGDYQARPGSIVNNINIFSQLDYIQPFAGNQRSLGGLLKTVFNPSHRLVGMSIPEKGSGKAEFGLAGYWVDGAINRDATLSTLLYKPYNAHSGVWQNAGVWYVIRLHS